MNRPLVELAGLTYTYPGRGEPALRGIDLEVHPGEFVTVAGGSGSGKSTLLRLLCGLVPHFHGGSVSGQAMVTGRAIREHGPAELGSSVGTVLQDPETQVLMSTVAAELAFPLENRGGAPAAVARDVEETALALGIPHLLGRPTRELSGGELQRVALGAALAGGPPLLCLDEPTSQLDPVAGDELIALLRRLNEDGDVAVLLAEHRLERCLPFSDRVIALEGGRIACDASPSEFLSWAAEHRPALLTPGASLLIGAGLPPVAGVRRARAALRRAGLLEGALAADGDSGLATAESPRPHRRPWSARRGDQPPEPVLRLDHVWYEVPNGPRVLRDVTLSLAAGERVALMGRNGAGKTTLLRHAAGLLAPTRGKVRSTGRVALLPQNPSDLLVHERVREEAPSAARAWAGLGGGEWDARHPRDLSGGERQRLALAVVLDSAPAGPASVVLLDEPTRGMDREHRRSLAELLLGLEAAVVVATHDPEFAAMIAERTILLADGALIADGSAAEILSGGRYFVTETARILGGSAVLPEDGIRRLRGGGRPAWETSR